MNAKQLEKELEDFKKQYYAKIEAWFKVELIALCEKYNVWVSNSYEPSLYDRDTKELFRPLDNFDMTERMDMVWDEVDKLTQVLRGDLEYQEQYYAYWDDKFEFH